MNIFIERTGETKEVLFEGTVHELLTLLNVNPDAVLVSRGNELITLYDKVSQKDSIKILSVVSGG